MNLQTSMYVRGMTELYGEGIALRIHDHLLGTKAKCHDIEGSNLKGSLFLYFPTYLH